MLRHSPFFILLLLLLFSPALSNPTDQLQTFLPTSSPPATIPSFPEQSAVAGCPVSLPAALFPSVKASCIDGHGSRNYGPLHRSRCCPVLAAWLYSAYAATALGRSGAAAGKPYDMPLLPDDSETCVDGLESAMREKGLELPRPNSTCDVVYCYCGIRLHQLSCPEAFPVGENVGSVGRRVSRLERDCSGGSKVGDSGNGGLAGCSKCLNSLYQLNKGKSKNSTALSERTSKLRSKECELMGLTWLLHTNRTKYLHTVTSVLRVIMMSPDRADGAGPRSCSLNSDGMPLAADSFEMSSALDLGISKLGSSARAFVVLCCFMCMGVSEVLAMYRLSWVD